LAVKIARAGPSRSWCLKPRLELDRKCCVAWAVRRVGAEVDKKGKNTVDLEEEDVMLREELERWLRAVHKMPSDFAPLDRETETKLLRYVFNRAIGATQRQHLDCVESVHAACPDATATKEKANE
jgi:hypothetical protein